MKSIFKEVLVGGRIPIKEVGKEDSIKYHLLSKEIIRGDASIIYFGREMTPEKKIVILKTYENQWIMDNEDYLKNEVNNLFYMSEMGIGPGVAKVIPRTPNFIYIPIEFCNGCSLDRYIEDKDCRIPIEALKEITIKVASLIQTCHGHGYLHGQINPKHIITHKTAGTGEIVFKLIGAQNLAFLNIDVI